MVRLFPKEEWQLKRAQEGIALWKHAGYERDLFSELSAQQNGIIHCA